MPIKDDPFVGESPTEVPLSRAPLVRVLCQIRFPEILTIEKKEFVAPFQEDIRGSYPVLRQEQGSSFVFGPQGFAPSKLETSWRFSDAKKEWRVTLTPSFVTLETTKYTSRSDFISRLKVVLTALGAHVAPSLVDRIGVRYVDRVEGSAYEKLTRMVRPEVLGLGGSAVRTSMIHCVQESTFAVEDYQVMVRSAVLPPDATFDPGVLEPIKGQSWVLDLDIYSTESMGYELEAVVAKASTYADRAYGFFRWATNDEFLKEYGGDV